MRKRPTILIGLMHEHRLNTLNLGRKGVGVGLAVPLAMLAVAVARPAPVAAATLWNQYDNGAGAGITSQNFEPAHDSFDSEAADDVAVPAAEKWRVKQVSVAGSSLGSGLPTGVNVRFYTSTRNGLPKTEVYADEVVPPAGFSDPNFVLPLDPVAKLRPGRTYWLSVQVNETFADGQWFWEDRTVQSGNPAVWRSPSSGSCTSFAPRGTTCGLAPTAPDQVFELEGKAVPVP